MHILVVGDDPDALILTARALSEDRVHHVETTSSPAAALRSVGLGGIDLVVADRAMSEMSGVDLCRRIRAASTPAKTWVILAAAASDGPEFDDALDAGVDEFVRLPIDPAILRARVRSIDRLVGLDRDLDRRVAERTQELIKAQRDVEEIVSSIPDSLLTIDNNGCVQRINQPLMDLLGYSAEELTGLEVDKLFGQGFYENAIMRDLHMDGLVWNVETLLRTKDGGEIPVLLSGSHIRTEGGANGGLVCVAKDITERVRNERQIRELAYYDSLTGLPNRRMMLERVNRSLSWARAQDKQLALLYLDLDRFKDVNDTMGHDVGDALLRQVSDRLLRTVRLGDHVAHPAKTNPHGAISRFGGDEFIVLLAMISKAEDAAVVARRILQAMSQPFRLDGREFFTGVSIGIAIHPHDGDSADVLLRNADTAMYNAKGRGRNGYAFYSPSMNVRATRRVMLENRLRGAMERDEFAVHYQPIFSAKTGKIEAAEALLRWTDAECGPVSPGEFIPIAEDCGLIVPITDWVLRDVCTQAQAWNHFGFDPVRMAVNLSAAYLRQPELAGIVAGVLDDTQLSPAQIEFEITETALMQDDKNTKSILDEISSLGIKLSLDDFGTGYSSLSHILKFPIQKLKIDRSFAGGVRNKPNEARLTAAIIAMAHSLGLGVVAEGVETEEHEAFLRKHRCDEVQGYLYSPAVAPEAFTGALVRERDGAARPFEETPAPA